MTPMDKFQPTNALQINNDDIGVVEYYQQFAYANMSEESRIEAITNVASICYANPKALGSESLYNRLAAESAGLPSSSFEFVPVLISLKSLTEALLQGTAQKPLTLNATKFGEWVENGHYLLTNYRAVVYDFEEYGVDLRQHFNTKEECDIISKHFHVFNFKVDLATRAQMVRHRVNWQELSRRYVSGKRVPFDFYVSEKMKDVFSPIKFKNIIEFGGEEIDTYQLTTNRLINACVEHYYKALEDGVKPEEARRILPQGLYTQLWGGFQPTQLENFFRLRLDAHAQKEIREVAQAMKELIS